MSRLPVGKDWREVRASARPFAPTPLSPQDRLRFVGKAGVSNSCPLANFTVKVNLYQRDRLLSAG